jgi:phosphatidylinositol alpha-1,6-mannosyltransferase
MKTTELARRPSPLHLPAMPDDSTRPGQAMRHLFVTVDYPPHLGGMARRHVELCRRFAPDSIVVSTVDAPGAAAFDAGEPYAIRRQPFPFADAKLLPNLLRWARSLSGEVARGVDVVHSGNLRPSGYPALWAARRHRVPYLVYVNGADVLLERRKAAQSGFTRGMSRLMLGYCSAVVANSAWTARITRELVDELRLPRPVRVEVIDLGTDPAWFRPDRDAGALRERWGVGARPLLLTVARLVGHQGQDVAIRALPLVRARVPEARYAIVGEGPDETKLRELAAKCGVADAVVFTGALTDDEIAEAYATADVYVGLSREAGGKQAEGFGISFVEAASSGTPSVAGDSGGVRSAVRDGETGVLVDPASPEAAAEAIIGLLLDEARREAMGREGRLAVERYYNWERVAAETRALAHEVARTARALTPS